MRAMSIRRVSGPRGRRAGFIANRPGSARAYEHVLGMSPARMKGVPTGYFSEMTAVLLGFVWG